MLKLNIFILLILIFLVGCIPQFKEAALTPAPEIRVLLDSISKKDSILFKRQNMNSVKIIVASILSRLNPVTVFIMKTVFLSLLKMMLSFLIPRMMMAFSLSRENGIKVMC